MSASEQMDTRPEVTGPMDVTQAVSQLRVLVCGLGAGLVVLSVVFNVFVLKQNRNLASMGGNRSKQVAQMQSLQQQWTPALNALAKYSMDKPEFAAIFKRHGIELSAPAAPDEATSPQLP